MAGDKRSVNLSDLQTRTFSALAMVLLAGGALWLGGWSWMLFVGFVSVALYWEWIALARSFTHSAMSRGLWNAAGMIYIGLVASMMLYLRQLPAGMNTVLMLTGAVVATDIGAYFSGRTFGGPKIAPAISPSKTWSGLVGGILGAFIVVSFAYGAGVYSIALGAAIAIVAQSGDFFESWMKRKAGVKDSSRLIPGHGGVFDRLDGLMAVIFVIGLMILTGGLNIV